MLCDGRREAGTPAAWALEESPSPERGTAPPHVPREAPTCGAPRAWWRRGTETQPLSRPWAPLFVCTPLGPRYVRSRSLSQRRRRPEYPTYRKARAAFNKYVHVAAQTARWQQHCFNTTTPNLTRLSAGDTLMTSPPHPADLQQSVSKPSTGLQKSETTPKPGASPQHFCTTQFSLRYFPPAG